MGKSVICRPREEEKEEEKFMTGIPDTGET